MEKRDIFLVIFTAVIGLLSGMYLYLTAFAPVYVDDRPEQFSSDRFEVVARAYGGCSRIGCPRVRITEDRSYQYVPNKNELETEEDTYPFREFSRLRNAVAGADLSALGTPRSGQCASFTDGADYAFDITYRGERFSLDTCETALANDAGLQTDLTRIFQVVATPEEFSFIDNEFQQAGVLGFVFPHLRER